MELHLAAVLALLLAAPPQRPVEPPGPSGPQASPPTAETIDLGVSLDRIQEAVARPLAIKTTGTRPVFRVEVFARKPTVEDLLGRDYLRGPVHASSTSHQEFLNMVTPHEFRGVAMFTNKEAMTIAATSLALQWGLMKAIDKLRDARTERAKEAARKEVLEAMNAIEAAKKKKSGS